MKLIMDQKNYIRMANTHIFVNITKDNVDYILDRTIDIEGIDDVAVMITNHSAVNENLLFFADYMTSKMGIRIKIYIRPGDPELEHFLSQRLINFKTDIIATAWYSIRERFQFISINFLEDHIELIYGPGEGSTIDITFPKFYYIESAFGDDSPGIFDNIEMRLKPEEYRPHLIEAFKQQMPEDIWRNLADDEIWDYIMEQGEWSDT